jgi:hypothetical protein
LSKHGKIDNPPFSLYKMGKDCLHPFIPACGQEGRRGGIKIWKEKHDATIHTGL